LRGHWPEEGDRGTTASRCGQDGHARPRIEQAAAAFGATLDERTREDIAVWLQLLQQWNARIDLTAARSDDELVDLMLADAFFLARACRPTPACRRGHGPRRPGSPSRSCGPICA